MTYRGGLSSSVSSTWKRRERGELIEALHRHETSAGAAGLRQFAFCRITATLTISGSAGDWGMWVGDIHGDFKST